MNRNEFAAPSARYGGVTLWMLNDRLEKSELVRQIREFRRAGWGAVITRTFIGLRTKYLSDEWMDMLKEIVAVAKKEKIKVWFQAGYMPSGIPDLPAEMAHKVLVKVPGTQVRGEKILQTVGKVAFCEKTLPSVIDFLNPLAVEYYLKVAYEKTWVKRFGREFGKTIESVWVDEPHFNPPLLPWGEMVIDRFSRKWGYPILANVASLFCEKGDFMKVRHHYWRVVLELLLEGYFAGVEKWCREHNVRFAGHLMGEDTIQSQIAYSAAVMPCYQYMHLPGIDHLTRSLTWPSGRKFILTPKQCASAANQLGKSEVLAEMYGVSTQGLTFEDRKRIGQWMAVLGVNYRCYHGSFYSMRGRRKRIYAPHLSYQQPWWPDNRLIADHFSRLSFAMREGRYDADVLVVHPVESGFCAYDSTRNQSPNDQANEPKSMASLNDSITSLSENLLKIHRGFDYGDETILAVKGAVKGGKIQVGEMTYKIVILPSLITLRRTTFDLLCKFIDAGGMVISAGELPERIDGETNAEIRKLAGKVLCVKNDSHPLKQNLDELLPQEIDIARGANGDPGNIWIHSRRTKDGLLCYLTNAGGVAAEVVLKIRGRGKLELWNLNTGGIEPLVQNEENGITTAALSFATSGSRLVFFRRGVAAGRNPRQKRIVVGSYAISSKLEVKRLSPNAMTLDWCRFRRGRENWSEELPVICVQEMLDSDGYRGPVTLKYSFNAGILPEKINLAVEDACDWSIRVNGKPAKYAGLPHFVDRSMNQIDIAGLLCEGENVIELTRKFEPLQRPRSGLSELFENLKGVELESVYLAGDFAVRGEVSGLTPPAGCARYKPGFVITSEQRHCTGDLLAAGYPFFAGRISLTGTVLMDSLRAGQQAILYLPKLDAVAAGVRINGKKAGSIICSPFELDVTKYIGLGENTVEIELVNSLRNLLGPHHRTAGEPDSTWGWEYTFYPDWLQKPWDRRANWTDDYHLMPFGLNEGARILVTRYI